MYKKFADNYTGHFPSDAQIDAHTLRTKAPELRSEIVIDKTSSMNMKRIMSGGESGATNAISVGKHNKNTSTPCAGCNKFLHPSTRHKECTCTDNVLRKNNTLTLKVSSLSAPPSFSNASMVAEPVAEHIAEQVPQVAEQPVVVAVVTEQQIMLQYPVERDNDMIDVSDLSCIEVTVNKRKKNVVSAWTHPKPANPPPKRNKTDQALFDDQMLFRNEELRKLDPEYIAEQDRFWKDLIGDNFDDEN